MSTPPLDPCKVTFKLECPKKWEELEIVSEGKGYCEDCQKHVYLCTSTVEFAAHVNAGRCVAVDELSAQSIEEAEELINEEIRRLDNELFPPIGILPPPPPPAPPKHPHSLVNDQRKKNRLIITAVVIACGILSLALGLFALKSIGWFH